jgi:hypothetical protein
MGFRNVLVPEKDKTPVGVGHAEPGSVRVAVVVRCRRGGAACNTRKSGEARWSAGGALKLAPPDSYPETAYAAET